jgi:hypothetical protein
MKKTIKKITALGIAVIALSNQSNAQWLTTGNALGSTGFLGSTSNQDVSIITNNTSRMYLTKTGNVGIGTNTPAFLLDVFSAGNASANFKSSGGTANLIIDRGNSAATSSVSYRTAGVPTWQTGTVGNDNFNIRNIALGGAAFTILATNSNVGIGINAPTEKLHVNGNGLVSGNINSGANISSVGSISAGTTLSSGGDASIGGNLHVIGDSIQIGTVETFTDAGAFTIGSNSDFVSIGDGVNDLGKTGARWRNVVATNNITGLRIGAGTPSPTTALHVLGNAFMTDTADQILILESTVANNCGIQFNRTGSGFGDGRILDQGGILKFQGSTDEFQTVTNDWMTMDLFGGNVRFDANVGIGVAAGTEKLRVCGTIKATELRLETGWCDYVFADDYKLKSLDEVSDFIAENKHLPGIEKATVVETEGLSVAKMSKAMMEKIEELTLYAIQQNEELKLLKAQNVELQNQINNLKK